MTDADLKRVSDHWTAAASPDVFSELSKTMVDAVLFSSILLVCGVVSSAVMTLGLAARQLDYDTIPSAQSRLLVDACCPAEYIFSAWSRVEPCHKESSRASQQQIHEDPAYEAVHPACGVSRIQPAASPGVQCHDAGSVTGCVLCPVEGGRSLHTGVCDRSPRCPARYVPMESHLVSAWAGVVQPQECNPQAE
eukprot:scaffold209727_cov46-Prasinocladus_malaysianus.AAC.1